MLPLCFSVAILICPALLPTLTKSRQFRPPLGVKPGQLSRLPEDGSDERSSPSPLRASRGREGERDSSVGRPSRDDSDGTDADAETDGDGTGDAESKGMRSPNRFNDPSIISPARGRRQRTMSMTSSDLSKSAGSRSRSVSRSRRIDSFLSYVSPRKREKDRSDTSDPPDETPVKKYDLFSLTLCLSLFLFLMIHFPRASLTRTTSTPTNHYLGRGGEGSPAFMRTSVPTVDFNNLSKSSAPSPSIQSARSVVFMSPQINFFLSFLYTRLVLFLHCFVYPLLLSRPMMESSAHFEPDPTNTQSPKSKYVLSSLLSCAYFFVFSCSVVVSPRHHSFQNCARSPCVSQSAIYLLVEYEFECSSCLFRSFWIKRWPWNLA